MKNEKKISAAQDRAKKTLLRFLSIFLLGISLAALPKSLRAAENQPASPNAASAQDQNPTANAESEKPASTPNQASGHAEHQPTSIGGELAKETRVSEGEEGEEHSDLKHSTMVQKLAKVTGLSVHGAHLLALIVNFAIIAIVLIWAIRKTVPGIMRARNESIQ